MIHFVTGKPGAGKSRYLVLLLRNFLRNNTGGVATNIPLAYKPWCLGRIPQRGMESVWDEWFREEVPFGRIRLLAEEEVRTFYRWRLNRDGVWIDIGDDWGAAKGTPGMLYLIDECWREWGSRDWASRKGDRFLSYAPVHRHLGDEVYLATQQRDQVDVALRRLAQDFQEVRNYKWERTLTFFKALPRTRVVVCQDENMRVVTECRRLNYPNAINHCYDTTGGVGRGASVSAGDVERKQSGISWWFIPVGCIVVFCLAMIVPRVVMKFTSGIIGSTLVKPTPQKTAAVVQPALPVAQSVVVPQVTNLQRGQPEPTRALQAVTNIPVVTAWSSSRRGLVVWTSDGNVFRNDRDVIVRTSKGFLMGGVLYPIPGPIR